MMTGRERSRLGLTAVAALAAILIVSGEHCPSQQDVVFDQVEKKSSSLLAEMGATGWRLHIHPVKLPKNTVVAAFSLTETGPASTSLTCEGSCYLVFIDTQPLHHFAHPTVIGLYDVENRKVEGPINAEWWPTIDGKSVFNTVASRRAGIFRDSQRVPLVPPEPAPSGTVGGRVFIIDPTQISKVWAVIVNGYYDPSDTFDEDTLGMLAVLQGLGIPDDHVEFLRPQDPQGTVDACQQASVTNLETALKHVKDETLNMGNTCDDFLLFYSAHGTTNNLACGTDPDHSATSSGLDPCDVWLCANNLKRMLEENVGHCRNVTVVIEACKSGSILDHFLLGPPSSQVFRSQPTQEPWQMFVSAAATETSAGDVDTDQDGNVADSGSETIWGYVEAFGSVAADSDDNGWIDFQEAVDYAQLMDATELHDGVVHIENSTGAPIAVHGSDLTKIGGRPTVEFHSPCDQTASASGSPCQGAITRCCDAELKLKVANAVNQEAKMPFALRVFRPQSDSDWKPYYPTNHPEAYMSTTVMVPGLGPSGDIEVTIDLGRIPKALKKGDSFAMKALIDHLEIVDQVTDTVTPPASGSAKSRIKLTVENCFWNTCCWWPNKRCPD